MWMDVAIVASIHAVGLILFGHFEEGRPKWQRVLKVVVTLGLVALISRTLGSVWVYGLLGVLLLFVLYIHAVWLPSKGINGWTAEPKARYYALRGWKMEKECRGS
jgi:hypothetical protein